MPGFGAISEFAIGEFAASDDVVITETPVVFTLAVAEEAVVGGGTIGEAATVLELAVMMDPPSGGFEIIEQLIYTELVPALDAGAGGAMIEERDTVSFEVGPAIAEGAIGEEGPVAAFRQPTTILMFARPDAAAGGAGLNETPDAFALEVPTDEIIARARAIKILTIAS